MLLSHARQTLDDAIEAYCHGRYCSPEKDAALARLIDDKPCILSMGGASNQASGNISYGVNNGGDLIQLCEAFVRSRKLFTPAENLASYIFPYLMPVNAEGAKLLGEAVAHFAHKYVEAA